jgi:eukaryotic-like serine/threonine-protein kinase
MSNITAPTSSDLGRGVTSSPVSAGDVIADKYEVERVLAEGGMGVVVAAQHKQLRRRVALKFLRPELCEMREVVARFLREAQAMTTIQNEHVARVLDVGTMTTGAPYMVMEYLEGEDLAQVIERRDRLPVTEAIDYVLQGMEALAEAHVHGFVHRDLKPSNLFVTQRPDGSPLVKVLDFGISKVVAGEGGGVDLTHAHGLLGSPLYMSPEQIRSSKSVDARADIWTIGIILFELVSGQVPFQAESVPAVLAAIIADDPPLLLSVVPDSPPQLSDVISRCLRRNREERYANVADLANALKPFASREGHHSIEGIVRVIAHHARRTTPVDLRADTPPKGVRVVTPLHGSEQSAPLSPLAATAADPSLLHNLTPEEPPKKDNANESTFGKYRLIAVLGQGGMADVFLAVLAGPQGLGFSKLVVIKRLRSNLASDPEFVAMLVDEARIAARLNHPNVVQTYEVGVIQNEYYIAMEYLDGQPLNRIVQRIRNKSGQSSALDIPLAFRLGIVRDLLAGVHHAHELADFDGSPLGLVHRDVTPQNVFVTYDGQVKVVDFGIAKARGRATETAQGILKGKVAYMAPEQAGAQDTDRRADVFAAGVVLWELLTGERLWKGLDDVSIIQKLMLDKIPSSPRAVRPDVPRALDAMVKKALSRKKGDRYATARDFQVEIERFMESEGLKCPPRELGEWIGSLFADRRKQTRSLIESQLSALRSESPRSMRDMRDMGSPPPSGPMSGSMSGPMGMRLERLDQEPAGLRSDPVMARSHPGSTTGSGARLKSRAAIVGGAAVVLAVIGIIAAISRTPPKPIVPPTLASSELSSRGNAAPVPIESTTVATKESSADRTPNVPADAPIKVALRGGAPGIEFAIDDEPKAKGPLALTKPRDKNAHRITATAPGYRPETKTVAFDADVTWTAQLAPTRGGAPTAGTTTAAHTASVASLVPAPPPQPTTSASGRRRRDIDPDNPYAQ